MARPRSHAPTYERVRNSARCWVNGRWVYLGPYGSPESKAEHARILAELAAATPVTLKASATVNQVLAAFWVHAEKHYRGPDGEQTNEVKEIQQALGPVRRLYGHTKAVRFGPLALDAVRQE